MGTIIISITILFLVYVVNEIAIRRYRAKNEKRRADVVAWLDEMKAEIRIEMEQSDSPGKGEKR